MKFNKETVGAFEQSLLERGYRKYVQHFKNEDYLYWKGFEKDENRDKGYSVGFAFYDYSKYPQFPDSECISVSLEFMLGNHNGVDRLDTTITDDRITVEEFEDFCAGIYKFYLTTEISKRTDEN